MPNASGSPIRFAGAPLEHYRHACAFFDNVDQERRVIDPFLREGLKRGEKAFHIVDPALRSSYYRHLAQTGLESALTSEPCQYELRTWLEVHLAPGRFDQVAMLRLVQDLLNAAARQGFPLTRVVGQMEWALEDCPGVDDLIGYESRLNQVLVRYRDPIICTYQTARFGGGTMMDILRTHPLVLVGDTLRENPFYVPPDRFLSELRQRG